MVGQASWLRFSALLSVGAFGVHQLRYFLVFGEDSGRALEHSGHGYLTAIEPVLALALAFAVGQVLWRLVSGRPGGSLPSRRALGLLFGGALLAVFIGQELIEGQLAAGHASGLAAVLGASGWVAAPIAFAVGALLAAFVTAAEGVADTVRDLVGAPYRPQADAAAPQVRVAVVLTGLRSPLARRLAGRGPPGDPST